MQDGPACTRDAACSSDAGRRRGDRPSQHELIHITAEQEREIYGEVVRGSIQTHVNDCAYDPNLAGRVVRTW